MGGKHTWMTAWPPGLRKLLIAWKYVGRFSWPTASIISQLITCANRTFAHALRNTNSCHSSAI